VVPLALALACFKARFLVVRGVDAMAVLPAVFFFGSGLDHTR
jgi:hypothetical protein